VEKLYRSKEGQRKVVKFKYKNTAANSSHQGPGFTDGFDKTKVCFHKGIIVTKKIFEKDFEKYYT